MLRLTKAAFTFNDSINYAAWKIERHTGVRVEVTPDAAAASGALGLKGFLEIVAARGDALAVCRQRTERPCHEANAEQAFSAQRRICLQASPADLNSDIAGIASP